MSQTTPLDERICYWQSRLLDAIQSPFVYENLPAEIPQFATEYYLLDGQCGFYKHTTGEYIVVAGSPYGVTYYPNLTYDKYVFAIPTLITKAEHIIGNDIVLLKSNPLMRSTRKIAGHYAELIAHTELSYKFALVNLRMPSLLGTSNPKNATDLKESYRKIEQGNFDTFLNNDILNDTMTNQFYVPPHGVITELLTAVNNLIRRFYLEIGIVSSKDKTQAILSDETNMDYQLPVANIDILFNQRKENCRLINETFGLDVQVKLNKAFKLSYAQAEDVLDNEKQAVERSENNDD